MQLDDLKSQISIRNQKAANNFKYEVYDFFSTSKSYQTQKISKILFEFLLGTKRKTCFNLQ